MGRGRGLGISTLARKMDTPREWATLTNRIAFDALGMPFYISRDPNGPVFRDVSFGKIQVQERDVLVSRTGRRNAVLAIVILVPLVAAACAASATSTPEGPRTIVASVKK